MVRLFSYEKVIPSYSPKFNEKRDLRRVSPFGGLDLKQAFATNAIPSDVSADEGGYNDIEEPDAIAGRVRNSIDAEVIDRNIKAYGKGPENSE